MASTTTPASPPSSPESLRNKRTSLVEERRVPSTTEHTYISRNSSTYASSTSSASSATLTAPNPPLGSPSLKRQRSLKSSLRSKFSFKGKANQLNPNPDERPLVVLRVQVISCKGLFASDRNGKSDPYVVLRLLQQRHQTPVIKSNLNPKWSAKDATFDFPIYASIIEQVAPIFEIIVWDKDLLGKDYLGEISLIMKDWFKDQTAKSFDDPTNIIRSFDLQSAQKKIPAQGSIQLLLGFVQPPQSTHTINSTLTYTQLFERLQSSNGGTDILSAPPTQGVGTVDRDASLDDSLTFKRPTSISRASSQISQDEKQRPRALSAGQGEYGIIRDQDIHGVVLLEVTSASDLPKLKNVLTRDGWDNDPFVVVSFSDKMFRTRVIRHELNPVWEEKLVFRVRKHHLQGSNAQIHLSVLDWDKLAMNDHVAEAVLDLAMVLNDENVPRLDKETGLYPDGGEIATTMKTFRIPLKSGKDATPDSNHPPYITVRAKFQPHDAMRQRFWRQQLKQIDTNHTGRIARREITNLASTLSLHLDKDDLDRFFEERGDSKAEVSIEEMIVYLENSVAGMNVPYPKTALAPPPTVPPTIPPVVAPPVAPVAPPVVPSTEPTSPASVATGDNVDWSMIIVDKPDDEPQEKDLTRSTNPIPDIKEPASGGDEPVLPVSGDVEPHSTASPSSAGDGSGAQQPKSEPAPLLDEDPKPSSVPNIPTHLPPQPPNMSTDPLPTLSPPSAKGGGSSVQQPVPGSELRPAHEPLTPLTPQPLGEHVHDRPLSDRDQILAQLAPIFEAHSHCTRNHLGILQVPADAIMDILVTFTERYHIRLLDEDEITQLVAMAAPVTPDNFVPQITRSMGNVRPPAPPSPPPSPRKGTRAMPKPGLHAPHQHGGETQPRATPVPRRKPIGGEQVHGGASRGTVPKQKERPHGKARSMIDAHSLVTYPFMLAFGWSVLVVISGQRTLSR